MLIVLNSLFSPLSYKHDIVSTNMILLAGNMYKYSCDGNNLKVGGGTRPAQSAGKNFLVAPLHFFGSKSTIIVVLMSAFVIVSIVWSVSCLLVFYSRCPRAPVLHRVGATVQIIFFKASVYSVSQNGDVPCCRRTLFAQQCYRYNKMLKVWNVRCTEITPWR